MNLNWRLAWRNIARNKRRTLLTASLVSFSLVALIFTDGLIISMSEVMVKSATRMWGGDATVEAIGFRESQDVGLLVPGVSSRLAALEQEPEVEAATARTLSFGMLASADGAQGVQVVGVDLRTELQVSRLGYTIAEGELLTSDNQIMIGTQLAEKLDIKLGDRIVVSLPMPAGDLAQDLFRVGGIFSFNSPMMDEGMAFIQLQKAQQMLQIEDAAHQLVFNLKDPNLARDSEIALWDQHSDEQVEALSWVQTNAQLASILSMTGYATYIVGLILFAITALGVINTIFMSIYERTYEFGVLLAIGTRSGSLVRLIMLEALQMAVASAVIGTLLGIGLNLLVAHFGIDYSSMEFGGTAITEFIRPVITLNQLTGLPLYVVILTLVAAIYPALHAGRIIPAKALHKSL